MTFVAEFIDRLTGPSTKAKKAVEDLGKASANAAKAARDTATVTGSEHVLATRHRPEALRGLHMDPRQ